MKFLDDKPIQIMPNVPEHVLDLAWGVAVWQQIVKKVMLHLIKVELCTRFGISTVGT